MRSIAAALAFSLWALSAAAQDYPTRPVRIVIPLSPGGTTDVPGRIIAQKLSESLGQQFFVENRAGAGGTIGSDYVAKAKADGYTLLLTASPFGRERSISPAPATAARSTWSRSSSCTSRASSSTTCRTRAAGRRSRT
ncbi:MAG: hypothetical protein E6H59_11400 [Betaproteobacteria bacterium]|nr:MAG: hypothetical protein E6H59_11400 [Betaproteobacteria bacterium]